jgi:hypothetical protein
MRATGCSARTVAVRSRLLLLACLAAASALGAARAEAAWNDPAPYCRATGTIDAPDARYTGPAMPDWIARALMRAVHAPPDAPLAVFRHAAWRCLDGAVLACAYGANIPCDQKADPSHTPTIGAKRYCAQNRASNVVPAFAAGRATIFEWRCAGGEPVIARQILDVDAAGYPSAFWHRVAP